MNCALDGIDQVSQPAPQNSDMNEWLSWRIIYSSNLSEGNHTLQCDVVKASDENPFRLSSFGLYSSDPQPPSTGEGPPNGQSNATITSSTTSTNSVTMSASPSNGSRASSKTAFPIRVVLGGVLGGLAAVAMLVLLLVLFLRRRQHKNHERKIQYVQIGLNDDDGAYLLRPFPTLTLIKGRVVLSNRRRQTEGHASEEDIWSL